jgi:hypothetical protein
MLTTSFNPDDKIKGGILEIPDFKVNRWIYWKVSHIMNTYLGLLINVWFELSIICEYLIEEQEIKLNLNGYFYVTFPNHQHIFSPSMAANIIRSIACSFSARDTVLYLQCSYVQNLLEYEQAKTFLALDVASFVK